MAKIRIHWGDGFIRVSPVIPPELTKALRYWHREFVQDPQTYKMVMQGHYRDCYQTGLESDPDTNQSIEFLLTLPGFMHRIKQRLQEHGYEFEIIDGRMSFPKPDMLAALNGLREYQMECSYTALTSGGGVIACPTGWGKCLSPSTPILYADGTVKPISEVKVDDLLMGDDSTPRKVLERIDGFGPMYRITPLTGRTIEVADHHILSLVKSGDCKRDKYPDGHTVAITVEDYLKQSKTFKYRHKLYRVPVEFATQPVTIDPYWLGLWLGDGDWNRPTITTADAEVVSAIQTYAMQLGLRVNNTGTRDSHRTPSYSIVKSPGQDNVLLQRMRSYGLLKSEVKRIPREFLINSREIRLQLLAGLMDSDGSLNEGTDFDFVGTNQALVTDVEFLARTLGFRVHASKRKCTGFGLTVDAWRLRISGATHLIPTKIKRKQAKVRKQVKDGLRTGFKVERIADGPYVGVRLDGNMLHLLDDCTVLHNTHIIASLLRAYKQEDLCARNTPLSVITTASKDIAEQNYNSLKKILPGREIGLIMSGRRERSDDIQVITLDSLQHLNPDEIGIMVVDEVHEAATAARSEQIQLARFARRWGASATPSGRYDGSDLVTEGLVGPVVYRREYQQGVLDGALVPIVVYWVEVPHPHIGLTRWLKYKQHKAKYDWGVDRNESQNNIIIDLMKKIPDTLQTLCIMRHTAQMNLLAPSLPGLAYVHAKTDAKALQTQRQYDLVPISAGERKTLYTDFRSGKIRKIMSTYVYKQGVDFPELEVMVNAGGGGSEIVSGQIPGRGSRPSLDKDKAVLIDFWHPWDTEERNGKQVPGTIFGDDTGRDKIYAKLGFERHWVKDITQLPFMPGAVQAVPELVLT